jgi:hypothetical protein
MSKQPSNGSSLRNSQEGKKFNDALTRNIPATRLSQDSGPPTPTKKSVKTSFGDKDSPKTSMSKTSFESDEMETYQDMDDPKLGGVAKDFKLGIDSGTFVGSFNAQEADIFTKLCPKDRYKENPECSVCKVKFTLFNTRQYCKFCGLGVCKNCSLKTRPDPEKKTDYHKICDVCHGKYINKVIENEFMEQFNEVMEKLKKTEAEMQKDQTRCKHNHTIYDELNNQKQAKNAEYTYAVHAMTAQINDSKQRIKALERETLDVTNQSAEKEQQLGEYEDKITEFSRQVELKSKTKKALDTRLNELDKAISSANNALQKYEKDINEFKMEKIEYQPPPNKDSKYDINFVRKDNRESISSDQSFLDRDSEHTKSLIKSYVSASHIPAPGNNQTGTNTSTMSKPSTHRTNEPVKANPGICSSCNIY